MSLIVAQHLTKTYASDSVQVHALRNIDLKIDFNDVMGWIKWSKGTCIGDVNLDGAFDSTDLVQLFQQGLYETGQEATWTSGDWNGDFKFDSSDLLLAFQEGCYEGGAVRADSQHASTLPEPATLLPMLWALGGILGKARSWRRGTGGVRRG